MGKQRNKKSINKVAMTQYENKIGEAEHKIWIAFVIGDGVTKIIYWFYYNNNHQSLRFGIYFPTGSSLNTTLQQKVNELVF